MNDQNRQASYKKFLEQFAELRQESGATNSSRFFDNSISQSQEWLTTNEAACYLGVSASVLRNMTSNGQVPYYKLGRRNRYKLEDLRSLLEKTKKGGFYVN